VTAVKITGIRTVTEAEQAVAWGVEALGLCLDPGATRGVDVGTARAIVAAVGARTLVVGILPAAPLGALVAARDASGVACLELCGEVPPETLAPLLPHAYVTLPLHHALLDADAQRYGGRYLRLDAAGVRTDDAALWGAAARLSAERRITIAGALTPANVGAVIARVAPFCVDLSLEDHADPAPSIAAFVAAVRDADARTLSARATAS
jgi:phosphoribosylanthranilate isomerase